MKLTSLLATGVATAALTLAPTAAFAASNAHTDSTGDVVSIGTHGEVTPEPAQVHGDITGIRVNHLKRNVRVTLQFRDLSPSGDFADHFFQLRTNKSQRNIDITAGPGVWRGESGVTNANDKKVACKGLTHKIDYTANTVRLVVPRSCLGNPKWVRVGAGSVVNENGKFYADDARAHGLGEDLVMGPRVRR